MLKDRKIKLQAETIRRIREDNLRLNAENKALKEKLLKQTGMIEAAEQYRKEHLKALSALNDAKERYHEAVREIAAEKKRYRKEFGECMKGIG